MSKRPNYNCLPSPQGSLNTAFKARDLELFKKALEQDASLYVVDNEGRTIFDKACQTPNYREFIKVCLENGCDVNRMNSDLRKYPIHFAVESQDPENLLELFNHLIQPNVDIPYDNRTPILLCAEQLTEENFEQIFHCIKILIKNGADLNICNHKNITPILLLALSEVPNVSEIIRYILENCDVDLDTLRDGEAREVLEEEFPKIPLPPVRTEDDDNKIPDFQVLKSLLKEHKEGIFIQKLNKLMLSSENENNKQNVFNENSGDGNLLQVAVEEGLKNAVHSILRNGASPNLSKKKGYSAISIACLKGDIDILKVLSEEKNIDLNYDPPLLTILIRKFATGTKDVNKFKECFEFLLNNTNVNINATDDSDSTALHLAVRYKNKYATEMLLEKGAYIGVKNTFNDLPIKDINPLILEKHFDSCIMTNEGKRSGDDDFEIWFNYKSLVPALNDKKLKNNKERPFNILNEYAEEMLPIDYMTKSPELRRLVKHPLISSFLWLKWHRLGAIFYTNFALYSIFCISMIMYLVFCYGHNDTNESISGLLYTISVFGVLYVIIREIMQFSMLSGKYFSHPENWIEISLIIITLVVLSTTKLDETYRRMISAIAILLAATEFSLLVGSLPVMSIATHMEMLKTVSISFIRSLVLYSIIIVSFALCFYTLLGGGADITDEEEKFNTFVDPGTAIIKTIVMFTGEYEAASINFGTNKTTYFVFVLFVFFISIVLLNLLNGLAVNDTQVIKSEAELTGFISRARLLSRYEKMMIGQKNSNCGKRNWFVRKFFGNLISIFPHFLPNYKLIVKPNERRKVYIEQLKVELTTVVSSEVALINKNDEIEDNKEKKEVKDKYEPVPLAPSGMFCCLCNTRLDYKIMKYTLSVMENIAQNSKLEEDKNQQETRLKNIEIQLQTILQELRSR